MLNREVNSILRTIHPYIATYYDNKYGVDKWVATRDKNGVFNISVPTIKDKHMAENYNDLKIASIDKSGFAWLDLNREQAIACMASGKFELFERINNEAESLITSMEELLECLENNFTVSIEVGYIDPDFNSHNL